MADTIDDYVEGISQEYMIQPFSQNILLMALLADAYYGAVYNTIDMANSIREQHSGDASNGWLNSIVSAAFAVVMAVTGFAIIAARPVNKEGKTKKYE